MVVRVNRLSATKIFFMWCFLQISYRQSDTPKGDRQGENLHKGIRYNFVQLQPSFGNLLLLSFLLSGLFVIWLLECESRVVWVCCYFASSKSCRIIGWSQVGLGVCCCGLLNFYVVFLMGWLTGRLFCWKFYDRSMLCYYSVSSKERGVSKSFLKFD